MGQQQLLLIILGVIVVGIAVVVGITMFQDNAISANRDALTNDLVNLGARAQQLLRRPWALGGCQNDWTQCVEVGVQDTGKVPLTMAMLASGTVDGKWTNPNGTYEIQDVQANRVVLLGTGIEKVSGGALVSVLCTVTADNIQTNPQN